MKVPRYLKHSRIYPPARAAVLSLRGPIRFYNPVQAASWCDPQRPDRHAEILKELTLVSTSGQLSIWKTPAREIATMATEIPQHVAFLLTEFEECPYFSGRVCVEAGDIVLDVGANIGLFAMQALNRGASRIVCFEPAPGTRAALCWNLRTAIEQQHVSVVNQGAWDRADTLTFTVDPEKPASSSLFGRPSDAASFDMQLEVDTIDSVVARLALPRVDFVKMDIEGAELCALQGATETIRRHKPTLAVAVEHTSDPAANARNVRDFIFSLSLGYRCRPGRYFETPGPRLAPEILYFN